MTEGFFIKAYKNGTYHRFGKKNCDGQWTLSEIGPKKMLTIFYENKMWTGQIPDDLNQETLIVFVKSYS